MRKKRNKGLLVRLDQNFHTDAKCFASRHRTTLQRLVEAGIRYQIERGAPLPVCPGK